MDRNDAERLIRSMVSPARAGQICRLLDSGIGMRITEIGGPHKRGATHFGGIPDLPADQRWPHSARSPLGFIAQINLGEAHRFDVSEELPGHGLLSFFYDTANWPWGGDPNSAGGFRVLWFPDVTACRPTDPPPGIPDDNLPVASASVEMYQRWCLPDDTDQRVAEDLREDIEAVDWKLVRPYVPVGPFLLLGCHSYYEDHDVQTLCEMASKGETWSEQRVKELGARRGASHWRQLLTVSTERNVYPASWGDGGQLMYMIEGEELKRRAFERAWAVVATS